MLRPIASSLLTISAKVQAASLLVDHYPAIEFESNVIKSLQLTRAALLYFVDMIAQNERGKGSGLTMPLVIPQHDEIRGDEDTD